MYNRVWHTILATYTTCDSLFLWVIIYIHQRISSLRGEISVVCTKDLRGIPYFLIESIEWHRNGIVGKV
jgi:hypothetical protein